MRGLLWWLLVAIALSLQACGGGEETSGVEPGPAEGLTFEGQAEPLGGFSFDTGLVPAGSPVAASFKIGAGGKAKARASAAVASGSVIGNRGGGSLTLDLHVTMSGRLEIDSPVKKIDEELPGLAKIDVPIEGSTTFDPFLLDDAPAAEVVATIPETKLPPIPLGSVPGNLELTITNGSAVRSSFHGGCLSVTGGRASYRGQLETSGTLVFKGRIVTNLPPPLNVPVDLGVISVAIPKSRAPIDLGTHAAPGTTDGEQGSSCGGTKVGADGGGSSPPPPAAEGGIVKKRFTGSLAKTPSVAFGGGSQYCNYEVALEDVRIELTIEGSSVVSALVTDRAVERVKASCPYPAAPSGTQTFELDMAVPATAKLLLYGRPSDKPAATLLIELIASSDGYDAKMKWHRIDVGAPLDWTVDASLHLVEE